MIILDNVIGCIFWGVTIAIVSTMIVCILCKLLYRLSPIAYIILLILFILTGAQGAMLAGATYLKGYVGDAREIIEVTGGTMKTHEEMYDLILNKYPVLQPFLDCIDKQDTIDSQTGKEMDIVSYISNKINDTITYYILRRVLWLIGFMAIAAATIILFFSYRNSESYMYSNTSSTGSGLQF